MYLCSEEILLVSGWAKLGATMTAGMVTPHHRMSQPASGGQKVRVISPSHCLSRDFQIHIRFNHDCGEQFGQTFSCYPTVSACSHVLQPSCATILSAKYMNKHNILLCSVAIALEHEFGCLYNAF